MPSGLRALAVTYGVGAVAAALAAALRLPLPSLLGPLLATAAASVLGRPRPVVPGARQAGQAVVGATLGLYFTAEVLGVLGAALPWMAAAAAAALATGASPAPGCSGDAPGSTPPPPSTRAYPAAPRRWRCSGRGTAAIPR